MTDVQTPGLKESMTQQQQPQGQGQQPMNDDGRKKEIVLGTLYTSAFFSFIAFCMIAVIFGFVIAIWIRG